MASVNSQPNSTFLLKVVCFISDICLVGLIAEGGVLFFLWNRVELTRMESGKEIGDAYIY